MKSYYMIEEYGKARLWLTSGSESPEELAITRF